MLKWKEGEEDDEEDFKLRDKVNFKYKIMNIATVSMLRLERSRRLC